MQIIIRVVIVLTVLSFLKINDQDNQEFDKKLTEYISIQNKRIGFNGVVLVANDKEVLYQKTIGYASHELQVPLAIDSKFKIASISKAFTGMLVAIAVQEGEIKLDDKIKPFFSGYNLDGNWNKITIKHLVSHTSGIPHWKGYEDYWSVKSRFPLNTDQVLTDMVKMDLLCIPGDEVNYSSPAYFILASIIENIYNDTYANILEKKILKPLGLHNTGGYNESKIINGMSNGYHLTPSNNLMAAPYRSMSTLKGAGSLYSNANDLLKWNRSMMDVSAWKPPLLKSIFTEVTDKPMPHNYNALYGMGWYIHNNRSNNLKAFQVAGGTFGYSCISVIYPEKKLTLIILSNVSFLPVQEIWADVEKIILNKPFKLPKIIKEKEVPLEHLQKLSGFYMASNGMKLEMKIHQNKLFAILQNKPPFQIVAESDYVFFGEKVGVTFTFDLAKAGVILGVKAEGRGKVFNFKKE